MRLPQKQQTGGFEGIPVAWGFDLVLWDLCRSFGQGTPNNQKQYTECVDTVQVVAWWKHHYRRPGESIASHFLVLRKLPWRHLDQHFYQDITCCSSSLRNKMNRLGLWVANRLNLIQTQTAISYNTKALSIWLWKLVQIYSCFGGNQIAKKSTLKYQW